MIISDATVVTTSDPASGPRPARHSPVEFLGRCEEYFAWSGCVVDQPFRQRLADGLIRCYFVHDEVVGFSHQWPAGLLGTSR